MSTNRVEEHSDSNIAPIDLAREQGFTLGLLTVTPMTLTVTAGDWSQRLEPRAMQLLVVLARAAPAVVGRGELNARIWRGRIVGEDAINRAVQTLRRVSADAPPPAPFTIDTFPRVGYRLTTAPPVPAAAPVAPGDRGGEKRAGTMGPPRWHRAAALAVILLGVLTAVLMRRAHPPPAYPPPALPLAPWRVTSAVALDDLPPDARDVALSPDGRRLAYGQRDAQGMHRIFVRVAEVDGAGRSVSPPDLDARAPAWSPNGANLAFSAYEAGQPCRLYVLRQARSAVPVASCETEREPRLAWSADGSSILFGDKPGQNAVLRIGAVRLSDGQRDVLSSPPGNSVGDDLPMQVGNAIVFRRQFGWADEGWVARDMRTGGERLLWRRRGVTGSVAAPLPDGGVAIAWTRAGDSRLDLIDADRRVSSQPMMFGPITAISAAGPHLLVVTDRSESALARTGLSLVTMRGQISSPMQLPDGRVRFAVAAAGETRIWERNAAGTSRPWAAPGAATITGLTLAPNGRLTAALVIGGAGSEIVLFDPGGTPRYRWNPHARKLNPAAWSSDGRHLIVPVLDNAGWRLIELDPFANAPPRDLGLPGFAVVQSRGSALYAVRAGETTGTRELWRLDAPVRRLPFDLTLFDIVNWSPVDDGIWLPDRRDRDHPRLILRDIATGRIRRRVDAPGLAGAGGRLAAGSGGPVYVKIAADAFDQSLVTLTRTDGTTRAQR